MCSDTRLLGRRLRGPAAFGVLLLLGFLAFGSSAAPAGDTAKNGATPAPGATPTPKPARVAKKPEPWDPARARDEYREIQLELALAKTGNAYMVLDLDGRQVLLKVKGAVVWSSRLELAPEDSGDLERFVKRFKSGDDLILRLLTNKHLFASTEKTPDSILAIVGQVVKADPQLLQRDIPERFQLMWGWDIVLDVRTDVVGTPKSKFENMRTTVLEAVRGPFGEARLVARMSSDNALTLYRIAFPGLPTIIRGSSR